MAKKRKKAKKRRTRRVKRAPKRRKSMARRRKKSRRSKPSIPLLPVLPVAMVAVNRVQQNGFTAVALDGMVKDMTGYDMMAKTYSFDAAKPFLLGEAVGIIGHKVASRVGINRHIKRLTLGYFSL